MVNTVELKHKVTSDKGKLIKDFTPYIGILALVVLFALTTGGKFLRVANLSLILKQSVIVMIGALGSAFVLSHGNIDFSIGGELALCCLISYYVAQINPYLLLPACIIIGMLLSLFVSVVHVVTGIQAEDHAHRGMAFGQKLAHTRSFRGGICAAQGACRGFFPQFRQYAQ